MRTHPLHPNPTLSLLLTATLTLTLSRLDADGTGSITYKDLHMALKTNSHP